MVSPREALDNAQAYSSPPSPSPSSKDNLSLDDADDAGVREGWLERFRAEWREIEAKLRARGVSDTEIANQALACQKRHKYGMQGAAPAPYVFQEPQLLQALTELGVHRPERLLRRYDPDAIWSAINAARDSRKRLDNPGGFVIWFLTGR